MVGPTGSSQEAQMYIGIGTVAIIIIIIVLLIILL